jgi:hypothetical protein
MSLLRYDALEAAPLATDPYEYLVIPGFLSPETCELINQDFPKIDQGGSFPTSALEFGPGFAQFRDELTSTQCRDAFAKKFQMDLTGKPPTLTVRGMTRQKDGQVHLDSVTKLVTVLIYLNGGWGADGGRLRLLRSKNIDDVIAEVPPEAGTLIAFRCRDNAWHGHKPFVGERRSIQLNWVVGEAAARNTIWRHRISAFMKKVGSLASRP